MQKQKLTKVTMIVAAMIISLSFIPAAGSAEYPTKAVSMLIPFGVGGSADVMGRALANGTKGYLGQPIVAVNRPGAGGGIMYSALKSAKTDGYTIGWNSTSILTSTNIGNVPFKYDAFEHVCRIGFTTMPMAVRADAPWKTFTEMINWARKNPGKLKIGNAGTGSGTHLVAVLVEKEMGIQVVHVPLGGKRRVPSLLGGEVQAICVPLPEAAPQVMAGQMRLLAVASEKRDPKFPDVPTMTEENCPVVLGLFRGISVPKGTPSSVVNKLAEAFEKGSQDPSFKQIAAKKGFQISFQNNVEFNKYLKQQNEAVAKGMQLGGLVK